MDIQEQVPASTQEDTDPNRVGLDMAILGRPAEVEPSTADTSTMAEPSGATAFGLAVAA